MSTQTSTNPIKFYDAKENYNFLANTMTDFPLEFWANGVRYTAKGGSEGIFQGSRLFANLKENPHADKQLATQEFETLMGKEGKEQQSYKNTGSKDRDGKPIIKDIFQSAAFDDKYQGKGVNQHIVGPDGHTIQSSPTPLDLKERIMYETLLMKATQHPEIIHFLLHPDNKDKPIIENTKQATYNDPYWGNAETNDTPPKPGRNALGRLWVMARKTLQDEMDKNGTIQVRVGFSKELSDEIGVQSQEIDPTRVITKADLNTALKHPPINKADQHNMQAGNGVLRHTPSIFSSLQQTTPSNTPLPTSPLPKKPLNVPPPQYLSGEDAPTTALRAFKTLGNVRSLTTSLLPTPTFTLKFPSYQDMEAFAYNTYNSGMSVKNISFTSKNEMIFDKANAQLMFDQLGYKEFGRNCQMTDAIIRQRNGSLYKNTAKDTAMEVFSQMTNPGKGPVSISAIEAKDRNNKPVIVNAKTKKALQLTFASESDAKAFIKNAKDHKPSIQIESNNINGSVITIGEDKTHYIFNQYGVGQWGKQTKHRLVDSVIHELGISEPALQQAPPSTS